ncbi:MAG: MFS transporter [Thermoplasmata archaeon]
MGGTDATDSSYARLFRNRNYARVFSAGLGSVAGSAVASICLVWIVFSETRSAFDVALLGVAYIVPALLFSTLGGTLVDRYNRRRLMILADLSRAAAMGLTVLVLASVGFNLPVILGAYGVIGAFTTLFNPSEQAVIPALVPAVDVANANGLVQSSRSTLQFVGASLGGVLIVTAGPLWGLAVNAATFAVSALLLTGIRIPDLAAAPRQGAPRASYFADLREGFRWLWGAQGFFQLTISATFFNFCSSIVGTFLVVYATVVLHGSALVYASLLASQVGGTAIGSLLVGRLRAARYAGKAWVVSYGVLAGSVALALSLVPSVPVAIATLFVIGLLGGFAGTAWLTAAQLLVPTEIQGRYFGIDSLGSVVILPLSQIGGALLIGAYGTRSTYFFAAALWIVAGAVFLLPRALRELGVRPEEALRSRSDADGAGTP